MEKNINSVLSVIKKEFAFLNLTDNEILNCINSELRNVHSESELLKKVKEHYYNYISFYIREDNFNFLLKYIDTLEFDEKNLSISLMKFSSFLDNLNIEKDDSFYKKLFTASPILRKALFDIQKDNTELRKITNNVGLISLLEIYNEIYQISDNENNNFYFSSDILKSYLKSISQYPLLTFEEEQQLFKKYIEEQDEHSKNIIINSNLRLVVDIAKKYSYKEQLMDLIEEGTLGLMKAVEKFDYSKGYKFSTYATWWIRQRIERFINTFSSIIRYPVNVHLDLNRYNKAKTELISKLHREPTKEDLSKYLNEPISKLDYYEFLLNKVSSLDEKINEDSDEELGDLIGDTSSNSIEDIAETKDIKKQIYEGLKDLTDQERLVIILRFGLEDDKELSLEAIAKKFPLYGFKTVTRERIRQIENNALKKLRNSEVIDNIKNSNTFNRKKRRSIITIDNVLSNFDEQMLSLTPEIINKIIKKLPNEYTRLIYMRYTIKNGNIYINTEMSKDDLHIFKYKVMPLVKQILKDVPNVVSNVLTEIYNFDELSWSSLIPKIDLALHTGNYEKARFYINQVSEKQKRLNYLSMIENIEYNFEHSMKLYNQYLQMKSGYHQSLTLARLNIQLGNYSEARKLLEPIVSNCKWGSIAKLYIICIDILEKEYRRALLLANSGDFNLSFYYKTVSYFIQNKLNILDIDINFEDKKVNDILSLILNPNDKKIILNNVEKTYGNLFLLSVDKDLLLDDVKRKIKNMNGNHFRIYDLYKFHLDYPVGIIDGKKTSDICVTTFLGTKDIITMYPIKLSDSFNLEDNLYSEELKQKRLIKL